MLDIQWFREKPEEVKAALARRGGEYAVNEVVELDIQRRSL